MTHTGTIIEQQDPDTPAWNGASLWQRLTSPPESVISVDLRRHMYILASLLVVLIPVSAVALVLTHLAANPGLALANDPVLVAGMVGELIFIGCYLTCRSPRLYTASAVVMLVTVAGGAIVSAAFSPADADTLLVFVCLVVLIASLLLPVSSTIGLALVLNLAIIPLPVLVPGIAASATIKVIAFNGVMSSLIILAAFIRRRDQKQIEDQARLLTEAVLLADETNRLKSQFLATMSHELRTPLNAIIGFAEIMLMGLVGNLDDEATRSTERIHTNSERLLGLIDDLLDVSKIEAGRLEVVHEPFSPEQLLKEIERETRPLALEKGLVLTAALEPGLPISLVGDISRLEQVLLNLVTNGVKFTEKGAVSITMSPTDGGTWSIVVVDTGIGIPAHAQEFIFEKFRQVDGSSRRAYGGAGLGLAIARELVTLMDGTIRLQSKVGSGSTFTVTLPAVEPEKGRTRDV